MSFLQPANVKKENESASIWQVRYKPGKQMLTYSSSQTFEKGYYDL